jgi:hypothetical protein
MERLQCNLAVLTAEEELGESALQEALVRARANEGVRLSGCSGAPADKERMGQASFRKKWPEAVLEHVLVARALAKGTVT